MRALPRDECNRQWPGQANYFICAYSGGSSACSGDSGGGFVIHANGAWRIVGVASMVFVVNDECAISLSSGYVRVAWHAGWIRWVMG
jgi:secreted trypsin-like serine protease